MPSQERVKVTEDWKQSILLPVFKGKGDPLKCGSYRALKLQKHGMKVLERVLEKRLREQVKIDDMQFGLTPGKVTTDAIFVVRQLQEKFRSKRKTLYYAFVDLEKAYDTSTQTDSSLGAA
jgi:Reverse transcriptase (RNA-dependent DNA polymerase)